VDLDPDPEHWLIYKVILDIIKKFLLLSGKHLRRCKEKAKMHLAAQKINIEQLGTTEIDTNFFAPRSTSNTTSDCKSLNVPAFVMHGDESTVGKPEADYEVGKLEDAGRPRR
jgi:hypothetical protein